MQILLRFLYGGCNVWTYLFNRILMALWCCIFALKKRYDKER